MTENEARKIIAVMMVSYPNFKPIDVDSTAKTWSDMLSEYDYKQVDMALRSYILSDSSGFAPSIGQIVEKIHSISNPQDLNEMQAWALVRNALKNGYYGAEEEFEKLPPMVQKAVGDSSQIRAWSITDTKNVETVIQSNFMRTYRAVVAREKEVSKMPREIKKILEKATDKTVNIGKGETKVIEEKIPHEGIPMPDSLRTKVTQTLGTYKKDQ